MESYRRPLLLARCCYRLTQGELVYEKPENSIMYFAKKESTHIVLVDTPSQQEIVSQWRREVKDALYGLDTGSHQMRLVLWNNLIWHIMSLPTRDVDMLQEVALDHQHVVSKRVYTIANDEDQPECFPFFGPNFRIVIPEQFREM